MNIRVYYEDTDAGGVVYHGRYLGFLERGRTEFLRDMGHSIGSLHDDGIIFPVVRVEIDYKSPARLDDLLTVETTIASVGRTSFVMEQRVLRSHDKQLVCAAKVTLVCVDERMKPKRLPEVIRKAAGLE